MEENYQRCLANTLRWEGGYVNHPSDPGGATNKGVTQATYNGYRDKKGKSRQSVRHITSTEVRDIYRTFWNAVAGDRMPKGIDQLAFDGGVNSGPSRGIRWVAQAAGTTSRNANMVARIAEEYKDKVKLVKKSCDNRLAFLRGLGIFKVFGRGWMRRVAHMEALGVKMVLEAQKEPVKPVAIKEKKQADTTAKASGTGAIGGTGVEAVNISQIEPSNFDWIQWTLYGSISAAMVMLVLWCVYQWRYNRARVMAYKDLLEDKLETTWEQIKIELEKRT